MLSDSGAVQVDGSEGGHVHAVYSGSVMIDCGSTIKTRTGDIVAIITAISIRFEKRTYEVSYFFNGEYHSAWLSEQEFEVIEMPDKSKAGFV